MPDSWQLVSERVVPLVRLVAGVYRPWRTSRILPVGREPHRAELMRVRLTTHYAALPPGDVAVDTDDADTCFLKQTLALTDVIWVQARVGFAVEPHWQTVVAAHYFE